MYTNSAKHTTLVTQPLFFNPTQPPFVPQLQYCPPQLYNYVPMIAAAVASQASANVQENPHAGRIFTFNDLAINNYNNQSFPMAVATAVDFIMLHLHKGIYPNPETAIQDGIPRVLAIITSANIVNNPEIHYGMDHAIINEARRVMQQEVPQLNHEVAQMKMALAPPNPHQMGLGGYAVQQPQQQGGYQFNRNSRPAQYGSHRTPAQVGSMGFSQSSQTGSQQLQDPGPGATSDRYGYLRRAAAEQTQRPQQQQTRQAPAKPVELTLSDWTPSSLQQLPPAYRPTCEEPVISQQLDARTGKIINFIVLKPKEPEMDRSQHSLSPFQTTRTSPQRESRTIEVLAAQTEVVSNSGNVQVGPKLEVDTSHNEWRQTQSLRQGIFKTKYIHTSQSREKRQTGHTEYLLIGEAFVTAGDFSYVVDHLAKSRTLEELADNLGHRLMEFEGLALEANQNFVESVRKYVTKEFNLFLRNRCCVDGLALDDFATDYKELPEYLAKKRGDVYVTAMMQFRQHWLRSLFEIFDDDNYDVLLSNLVPEIGETVIPRDHATALFRAITVTTLDVSSLDLNVGFPIEQYAALIDVEGHPGLFTLGKTLMDKSGKSSVSDISIAHHYVVTTDNVVYELTPGPSGKSDTITITIVDVT